MKMVRFPKWPGQKWVEWSGEERIGWCLIVKPDPVVLQPPLQIDESLFFMTVIGGMCEHVKLQEEGIVSWCLPVSLSVNVVSGDEVYSLVYYIQQEQQLASGETWGSEFVSHFCLS